MLPQGEFARFLRSKGDERRELLIKLLNLEIYAEVGKRAGIRAEAAKSQAELHRQRLEGLAFATDGAHKEAKKRIKSIDKLVIESEGARPKIDESLRRAAEQQRPRSRRKEPLGVLEEAGHTGRGTEAWCDTVGGHAGRGRIRVIWRPLPTTRGSKPRRLAKDLPDLALLQGARDAHDLLSGCVAKLAAAAERAQQAAVQEARERAVLADAEAAVEASQAHLKALEIEHRAEDLAQALVVGEPCPVCQQLVKDIPKHHPPRSLTAAQKSLKSAKDASKSAQAALTAAIAECGKANGTISALEQEQQGLEARVKAFPDVENLNTLLATTNEQLEALAAARQSEDETSAAVQAKRLELEKLGAKTKTLQASYSAQRDTVVVLGPPAPTHTDLLSDWEVLVGWATVAVPVQIAAAEAAAKEAATHQQAAQTKTQALLDACAELDLVVTGDIVAVLQALAQAQAEARGQLTKIEEAIAEAKGVAQQIKELDEQQKSPQPCGVCCGRTGSPSG